MSSTIKDVVVIGAGLAGSSMAAALAHCGWDVLLVESDHLPRHKVCGEFLSPESQTILQTLGLVEAVAALQPTALTRARLVTQRGLNIQTELPGVAWGISRFALDQALAQSAQAQGAELEMGLTVKGYTRQATSFCVQLQGKTGTTLVQTRTVIAACGRHSGAGLPPPSRPQTRQQLTVGVKTHYTGIEMPAQVELYFFPGGYAGVNRVEAGRVNVCLLAAYTAFAQAGKRVDGLINYAAAWNPALKERLALGHVVVESATAVAPVDLYRPATPWADICCLGDTVTMIPPFCGDGMAMALRSTELCAPLADQFLRGTLSWDQWAAQYSHLWRQEFGPRLRVARLLQRLFDQPLLTELAAGMGRLLPGAVRGLVRATRG